MSDFSKLTDEEILSVLSSAGAEELKKRGYEYGWHKKRPFVGVIYILNQSGVSESCKNRICG